MLLLYVQIVSGLTGSMAIKRKSKDLAEEKKALVMRRGDLSAHVATLTPEEFVARTPEELRRLSVKGYHAYRELCREQTGLAMAMLSQVVLDSLHTTDIALKGLGLKAANILIEHGWGRPVQAVAVAEVKTENNEIVALSREKLEAIARAVMPEAVAEAESANENGVVELAEDDFEPYT